MTGPRRFGLVTGAFLLATVTNIVLTLLSPTSSIPFRPHDDDSLQHLVDTEQRSLHLEHAFYLDLGSVAGGRTLIAEEGLLDPVFVDGLADMSLALGPSRDITEGERLLSLPGATGLVIPTAGAATIEYLILAPAQEDESVYAFMVGETLVVAGESALDQLAPP